MDKSTSLSFSMFLRVLQESCHVSASLAQDFAYDAAAVKKQVAVIKMRSLYIQDLIVCQR